MELVSVALARQERAELMYEDYQRPIAKPMNGDCAIFPAVHENQESGTVRVQHTGVVDEL